jgi:hypothetical protein
VDVWNGPELLLLPPGSDSRSQRCVVDQILFVEGFRLLTMDEPGPREVGPENIDGVGYVPPPWAKRSLDLPKQVVTAVADQAPYSSDAVAMIMIQNHLAGGLAARFAASTGSSQKSVELTAGHLVGAVDGTVVLPIVALGPRRSLGQT